MMKMTVDKALKGLNTAVVNLDNARAAADTEADKQDAIMKAAREKRNAAIDEAKRASKVADNIKALLNV